MSDELELAIARVDGAVDNLWHAPVFDITEAWGDIVSAFAELDKLLPESLFEVGERGYTWETKPWPDAEPGSLEDQMRSLFACFRQARTFFNGYGAFTTNFEHLRKTLLNICVMCPQYHGEIGWMFGER